jgi:hypothetical protein
LVRGHKTDSRFISIFSTDDVTLRPMFSWLMQRSSCISQGEARSRLIGAARIKRKFSGQNSELLLLQNARGRFGI